MASNTSHNSLPTVHTDSQSGEFVPLEIFVTNDQRRIAEIIIDLSFSFIVACVGIVTNILVVIVFSKQGFKDSVSVSMTIIACWDFFKCVAGVLQRLPGPMSLASAALAKSWSNISAIEFNYFLSFSTYVASVLAAYVSVERCLCVSMPFKVKELITPKVALFFGLLISAVVFGCFMVMFFVYDIVWIFSDHFNATIAVYVNNVFFSRNPGPLFQYYNLSGIVWPTSSLGIIAGSTAIIAYHLRKSSQFRLKSASAGQTWDSNIECSKETKVKFSKSTGQQNQMSTRDRQVVKMLLVVMCVNLVMLTPRIVHYTVKYFIYEFYFLRTYHNIFICMTYFLAAFDLIDAAIPLFIFYPMSTSFRTTFNDIFRCVCVTNKAEPN
ncbi:neuropeptide receptor 15 [Biomphalaria glabrata]|uniref:G-protein coupled receptors family 1 profile domain-containing protein n=1 Tax=Biomphalaria glabrata TaxID=6526 RepID=A0A2C9K9J9_BIOGL|nr:neuropeptide receptor 15 [Biomphalaria glabrata]